MVAAPVIGLVVDEIRNSEFRRAGRPPIDSEPTVSTCTCSPWATRATRPGTRSSPTCRAATAANRSRPAPVSGSAPGTVRLPVRVAPRQSDQPVQQRRGRRNRLGGFEQAGNPLLVLLHDSVDEPAPPLRAGAARSGTAARWPPRCPSRG